MWITSDGQWKVVLKDERYHVLRWSEPREDFIEKYEVKYPGHLARFFSLATLMEVAKPPDYVPDEWTA